MANHKSLGLTNHLPHIQEVPSGDLATTQYTAVNYTPPEDLKCDLHQSPPYANLQYCFYCKSLICCVRQL